MLILLFVGLQSIFAQDREVSGVVTSAEDGLSLPGVSVSVKGTTLGTSTDFDGKYSIKVPAGSDVLLFSFVGMKAKEVKITGATMNVVMESESVGVEEVMVVAYGTAKKSSFTGSAAVVKSEELAKKSVANVTKALAGEVAGVQVVNSSGQPGEEATIRIRGIGSINASSRPLYIVDGVPYNGSISSISPSDIASTTVLKDASATAIYGSRGANGVVVITTKQGKKGKNDIEVEFKYGINKKMLPSYNTITSPEEYLETSWEGIRNYAMIVLARQNKVSFNDYWTDANLENAGNQANALLFSGRVGIAPTYNMWKADGDKIINPVTGKINPGIERRYTPESWEDAMFSTGKRHEANVRFKGGAENITYYTSVGLLKDKGYYINSSFKRITARTNIKYQPKKWLNSTTGLSYTYSKKSNPGQTTAANNGFSFVNQIPSIYPVYERDAEGKFIPDNRIGGNKYDYGRHGNDVRRYAADINPAGAVRLDKKDRVYHETTVNQLFKADLSHGFSFQTRFGLQHLSTNTSRLTNPLYGDAKGLGRIFRTHNTYFSHTWNQLLKYSTTFNDVHNINAFIAHENSTVSNRVLYAANKNIVDPHLAELNNGSVMDNMQSYKSEYNIESYFGQINYDYDGKYFLYGTFRKDGSSRFSKGNRWGKFGSIGVAWVLTKEDFMQNLDFIKFLKIKASYGVLGNQSLLDTDGYSDYSPTITTNSIGSASGKLVLTENDIKNKDITWEKAKTFNTGIEGSISKYVDFEIDYFDKRTEDLLFTKQLATSTGNKVLTVNDGKLLNKGLEFNLTIHAIKTNDLKVDFRINGATYKNEITQMPNDPATGKQKVIDVHGIYAYSKGHSQYDFYMREWAGVDPQTGQGQWLGYFQMDGDQKKHIASLADYLGKGGKEENLIVEKVTDYNKATLKYLGKDAIPDLAGAFNIDVKYKGFSASAQFMYSFGGYAFDEVYSDLMHNKKAGARTWSTDIRKRWRKPGDITDVPRLSNGEDNDVDSSSSRFLIKSDYIALNNIKIGYDFSKKMLESLGFSEASVWISGDNLWMKSKRTGFNPTTSITGRTKGYKYAPLSTVTMGVRVKF